MNKILNSLLKLAFKATNNLIIKVIQFSNIITFKLIVVTCTLIYLIFFLFFIYFTYKSYLIYLQELTQMQSLKMSKDLAKLIYDFPLVNGHINQIPNETIELIYKINGFNNYSEFIYPINKDVEMLHQLLNYEPEVASRYSSMIIQDIINNNAKEIAEISEQLIKRIVKYSIPLGVLSLTFIGIHIMEPIALLA